MNVTPQPRSASRADFSAALCSFINDELPPLQPKLPPHPRVDARTPLFATGLIDSMAILHVIAFVEKTTGRGIQPEEVVMKNFATVDAIVETFGCTEHSV
jgi:acyl carrier protein